MERVEELINGKQNVLASIPYSPSSTLHNNPPFTSIPSVKTDQITNQLIKLASCMFKTGLLRYYSFFKE